MCLIVCQVACIGLLPLMVLFRFVCLFGCLLWVFSCVVLLLCCCCFVVVVGLCVWFLLVDAVVVDVLFVCLCARCVCLVVVFGGVFFVYRGCVVCRF